MVTILVSGCGTGIGKTHVTTALARTARTRNRTVQIVKPVQTGVAPGEPSDADLAADGAGLPPSAAVTLRRYAAPLAPYDAATAAGATLDTPAWVTEILARPPADVRLVEGAGGLAVPLGSGSDDWVEFAIAIRVDAVVLVVPDELGAINQSRLVYHYLQMRSTGRLRGGILLNALRPAPADVRASNRRALTAAGIPLWGELAQDALAPMLYPPLDALLLI